MTPGSGAGLEAPELRQLLMATAGVTGDEFFRSVVSTLGELLHVDRVFVGERIGERIRRIATWQRAETVALCDAVVDGEGSEYVIAGTPCERLVSEALVRVDDLGREYGDGPNGVSYVGVSFAGPAGDTVGVICALGPPSAVAAADPELLQVVALRAAAELERARAVAEFRARTEARLRHQSAQLELAQIREVEVDAALRAILPIAARSLGVERTSYWSLVAGGEAIACELLHVLSDGSFSSGALLDAKTYPAYFAALRTCKHIDASDALSDPRTREFTHGYFDVFGIGAMLDVPVWRAGRLVGVICLEHVGGARAWTPEEQDFASSVATAVSVALEASRRARAEERYRLVSLSTGEVVWEWDFGTDNISWSSALDTVFGYPADEEHGGRWWLDHVHAADRERVGASIRAVIDGGGFSWRDEYRFVRSDGTSAHVIDRGFVTRDANGRGLRMTGSMQDVTTQKALEARLLLADRMASMGTLAAGVAHEINNPLAYVQGNLDFVLEKLASEPGHDPEVALALEDAREGAIRVREIVRDLKMFSRSDVETSGPVDVESVVQSSIAMAWNEIRHRARLVRKGGASARAVATEARLGQVILNLLVNAAQAIPEGATAANEIRVETGVAPDGRVFIEVGDTGPGISQEVQRRMFDPFFTTKAVGEGTGLGLAICHSIVTSLGGEITVDSELGRGASFRVLLPAAAAAAASEVDGPPDARARVRRARVLVVDDDPSVAASVRRILGRDHDVVVAAGGAEAIATIEAGPPFAAVVCDIMMPGMSGIDVHAELANRWPELARRMVFMTGGAFTPRARAFLAETSCPCLEKPFDHEELRRVVAAML